MYGILLKKMYFYSHLEKNRLKDYYQIIIKFLDKLISNDQTGFVKGRFIGENIRLVYDIMNFTERKQIPGLIMLIDVEKAVDSVLVKRIIIIV